MRSLILLLSLFLFSGIFFGFNLKNEDPNKDKLVTYTLVSGLKRPAKRIEGLKKFLK